MRQIPPDASMIRDGFGNLAMNCSVLARSSLLIDSVALCVSIFREKSLAV